MNPIPPDPMRSNLVEPFTTTRLYYTDSLLMRFEATVTEAGMLDGRHYLVVDRTAFYPTSGGQPFDVGRLGPAAVIEVMDRDEDGAVLHIVDTPIPVGQHVTGEIDEARRLDHMQQHTGQHLLSAALVQLFDARTVSFHLGTDDSTIDVAANLDAETIARVEDEANRIVRENRPVTVRFVDPDEAARLPLRKEPSRSGRLRVVEVEDFDLSACGGTHVASTGSIGVIALAGWERHKGGTRVTFLCGGRAIRAFRRLREVTAATSRQLSVHPHEIPDAIVRLQMDARAARQQIRSLGEQVARLEADAMRGAAEHVNGRRVLVRVLPRDAAGLKALALAIAADNGPAVLLYSEERPAQVVVARGGEAGIDAGAIVKGLTSQFGGKGGGPPELAQGGGLDAEGETLRQAAYRWLAGA
jgi:alanyl-tRNA synthetase